MDLSERLERVFTESENKHNYCKIDSFIRFAPSLERVRLAFPCRHATRHGRTAIRQTEEVESAGSAYKADVHDGLHRVSSYVLKPSRLVETGRVIDPTGSVNFHGRRDGRERIPEKSSAAVLRSRPVTRRADKKSVARYSSSVPRIDPRRRRRFIGFVFYFRYNLLSREEKINNK